MSYLQQPLPPHRCECLMGALPKEHPGPLIKWATHIRRINKKLMVDKLIMDRQGHVTLMSQPLKLWASFVPLNLQRIDPYSQVMEIDPSLLKKKKGVFDPTTLIP